MIIARRDNQLRMVTQNDHAHFAGALLALWRTDGLPDHPRRNDLLFAAREHDNGWQGPDAAPMVDPDSGQPYDFRSIPHQTRQTIWQQGPARHMTAEPYAALLITEHARHLHRDRRARPEWQVLAAQWDAWRTDLQQRLDIDDPTLAADYRWLDLLDSLSLIATNGLEGPFSHHGFTAWVADQTTAGNAVTLGLEPFPLAGSTTFRVGCRWLPDRLYRDDTDLALALVEARWTTLTVQVVAGPV